MMHMSRRFVFIFANNADPDEMQYYAVFHLRIHYLPKYLFKGIQNKKGQCMNLIKENKIIGN